MLRGFPFGRWDALSPEAARAPAFQEVAALFERLGIRQDRARVARKAFAGVGHGRAMPMGGGALYPAWSGAGRGGPTAGRAGGRGTGGGGQGGGSPGGDGKTRLQRGASFAKAKAALMASLRRRVVEY